MPKWPPLPSVAPVVSRTLLTAALGTVGCARQVQIRIGQPDPGDYVPASSPSLVGTLQGPEGEALADTPIVVLVDGQQLAQTTDATGRFVVEGLYPGASIEIRVEGFEPVQHWHDERPEAVFVLVAAKPEPEAEAGTEPPVEADTSADEPTP